MRLAEGWVGQLIKLAKEIVPALIPDLYDFSAIDGQGFQINPWCAEEEAKLRFFFPPEVTCSLHLRLSLHTLFIYKNEHFAKTGSGQT